MEQNMFSQAFSFSGRIRRLEFGLSYIIYILLILLLSLATEETPLLGLLYIPLLWFWFAQTCKRFHDRGKSGARILSLFIPIYGLIVLFMLFFEDGEPCENDYGKDPKGRNIQNQYY